MRSWVRRGASDSPGFGSSGLGRQLSRAGYRRPNKSFKPNPLRSLVAPDKSGYHRLRKPPVAGRLNSGVMRGLVVQGWWRSCSLTLATKVRRAPAQLTSVTSRCAAGFRQDSRSGTLLAPDRARLQRHSAPDECSLQTQCAPGFGYRLLVTAHSQPATWLTIGSRFTSEQIPVAGTASPG